MEKENSAVIDRFEKAAQSNLVHLNAVEDGKQLKKQISDRRKTMSSNGKLTLEALEANIYKDNMEDNIQLLDIGYLVAMTGSDEVNSFAIKEYKRIFGEKGAYRLISQKEMKGEEEAPEYLISYKDDYLNINEAARDYPEIQEIEIGEDPSVFFEMLDKINSMPKSIPLFTKSKDGTLENIPVNKSEINIEDCEKLVYLGEKIK